MELLADCLITFGIGIQSVWLSMPAAVLLIKQGYRSGWLAPAASILGFSFIAAGAAIYAF